MTVATKAIESGISARSTKAIKVPPSPFAHTLEKYFSCRTSCSKNTDVGLKRSSPQQQTAVILLLFIRLEITWLKQHLFSITGTFSSINFASNNEFISQPGYRNIFLTSLLMWRIMCIFYYWVKNKNKHLSIVYSLVIVYLYI